MWSSCCTIAYTAGYFSNLSTTVADCAFVILPLVLRLAYASCSRHRSSHFRVETGGAPTYPLGPSSYRSVTVLNAVTASTLSRYVAPQTNPCSRRPSCLVEPNSSLSRRQQISSTMYAQVSINMHLHLVPHQPDICNNKRSASQASHQQLIMLITQPRHPQEQEQD